MKCKILICLGLLSGHGLFAAEYHVANSGDDGNGGSAAEPFKSISRAAERAYPGDTITVHAGVYRERINPPRGGTSDAQRIVYRAAPGEPVTIKGSERVTGWEQVDGEVWKLTLPNSYFGDFNPYSDLIRGDWYEARQPYHTGAVYLNGHWLKEAPRKAVLTGVEEDEGEYGSDLMQVEFLRVQGGSTIKAGHASGMSREVPVADHDGGKRSLGPMKDGDWLAFEGIRFDGTKKLALSAGSPVGGGLVEIRLGTPDGKLLGMLDAGLTAEWHHFQLFWTNLRETLSGKQTIILVFKARPLPEKSSSDNGYWFAEVDEQTTTIWAQFGEADPNHELVEINVRQTVFYPEEPGRNYITVRGFTLEQAANPWSPPTAEQIGLIGVNWSKGWVIEENTIRYAACTGLTLGKHGDEFDNTYNYYRSIRVGLQRGWGRENIGSHLVRNNHIHDCGQAGMVGSLGPAFSTVSGNEIHDIRKNHEYGGCETAGIKFHGAIDVLIADNHIYNCEHWGGIWLDWMSQGARVTGNLLHDNSNDLMFEMNHGPMLIDNNLLLSANGIRDASGGGAYVHNLVLGAQSIWPNLAHRKTPVFEPNSTRMVHEPGSEPGPDLTERFGPTVDQHDDRFYNNVFVSRKALSAYDEHGFKITADGNVYLAGAKPSVRDVNVLSNPAFDPAVQLTRLEDGWWLTMNVDSTSAKAAPRSEVSSELLGRASVSDVPFNDRDGRPYRVDTDYFGEKRQEQRPAPGAFRSPGDSRLRLKVWPKG